MDLPDVLSDCFLRLGRAEEFSSIRNFFRQSQFDDATVCRVLGIGGMNTFGQIKWAHIEFSTLAAPLAWCIQVFAHGLPADATTSQTLCGPEVFAAFHSVGLLRPGRKNPASVLCPVWVYPVNEFVVASDRREDPEGDQFTPPADVVFPAIYPGTLRFLRLLPDARAGEALDMCGGSGIGALQLSRSARGSATADITTRSAFFAEFNARLNGVALESLCGDLYEPVKGRIFDLIAAHPPFVPATGERMVYRDGGDSGEEITRRIIEALPAHLRPGGTAMVLCVAYDTENKTFEQRAKEWLGEAGEEFDIVFGLEKILSVEEVVESMRKRGQQIGEAVARELYARLRSLGTRQFVYGALFLRRFSNPIAAQPIRVQMTTEGTAADFERLLAWRQYARRLDFQVSLAGSRPCLVPHLELTVRHVMQKGELVPAEFIFKIETGFPAALRPDGWIVPLLARLTGQRTVQEVFDASRAADELPAGFKLEDFLGLIQQMIERGFMNLTPP